VDIKVQAKKHLPQAVTRMVRSLEHGLQELHASKTKE
jgi:hypothetical protein